MSRLDMSCAKFLKVTIYLQVLIFLTSLVTFALSVPYMVQLSHDVSQHYSSTFSSPRFSNAWFFAYGPLLPLLGTLRISVDIYLLKTYRFRPILTLITSATLFCLVWIAMSVIWWGCALDSPNDFCAEAHIDPNTYTMDYDVANNVVNAFLSFSIVCPCLIFLYIPVTAVAIHVQRREFAVRLRSTSPDGEKYEMTSGIGQ